MRKIIFFPMVLAIATGFLSCRNTASDPKNNSSELGYDSLSVAGDTVTQNANDFSTAVHQVMNDMNQIPVTGNVDRDYAVTMKSHFQGAVDIAQAALKSAKDNSVKEIAETIASTNKNRIVELNHYVDSIKKGPLTITYNRKDKDQGFNSLIKNYKAMMWDMSKMDTSMLADQQFAAVMIPHLQSGLYLSEGFVKYSKDAWLSRKAKESINEEIQQIEKLKAWVDQNKKTQ